MAGNARCPVCDHPAGPAAPEATCGQCGWPLYQSLRAGPVTPQMRRDFDARLQAARRRQADRDRRALDTELSQAIAGLTAQVGIYVIDVAAAQVTVIRAHLDEAGSPQVRKAGDVAWTSVLPALAAGPERHAQLADGIDGPADQSVAGLLRDRVPDLTGDRVLVICRPGGWQILEGAAAALARGPRARLVRLSGAGTVALYRQLTELAGRAPLRQPYWLMTATVDRETGAVALRPRQLFAAGAEPGAEARLTLAKIPGDLTDTTLAIFAGPGGAPDADGAASPLALYTAPSVPAHPGSRLRAVLDGPGRVRIVEPVGTVPHSGTWADVRRQIPARVTTAAMPVDLVCAVDMAGTREDVHERVRLVRELLQLLGAEYPGERRLRAGVVICTDHVFVRRRGGEYEDVTSTQDLGPADDALAWLAGQASAEIAYPPCAPVEDLLEEARRLLAPSRRAGRSPRVLTVAGRLPHPYPQPLDSRLPCPRKLMWRPIMDDLTQAGARCAAVADALPPGRAGQAEWRHLGPAGLRVLAHATARQVAEDLGLLAVQAQRIPLPLTDELEGAVR